MKRRAFPIACVLMALLVATGCAPTHPEYDALYARLAEATELSDPTLLEGRRIMIDPGHGGCFEGVVGIDSLSEADANLGVALYLWGLLKDAGAEVELTRTTDRDFSNGDEENLVLDLESRTAIANAFEPEVFISIHHNSNLPLDRERNRIEIYYREHDGGPSIELANDIHKHLLRNLGISDSDIEPASYHVLRNSTAKAAVLAEASYLSNPRVEEKLKLSTKQKLEGEAYFLGLVSYFSRGIPRVERHEPERDTLGAPGSISFSVSRGAGLPVDPGTAEILVGGRSYKPHFDAAGSSLRCALDPNMPNGSYEVLCSIRSIRGGTGVSKPFTLHIARPARFVLPLGTSAAPGDKVYLSVKALDRNGDPVADGTEIVIRDLGADRTFSGSCEDGVFGFETERSEIPHSLLAEIDDLADTLRFDRLDTDGGAPFIVIDSSKGARLPYPLATSESGEQNVMGDSRGLLLLPAEAGGSTWLVSAPGYRMKRIAIGEERDSVALEPRYGGVLNGMRIAIDPAGGGDDHQGLSEEKLRGAALNMEIARRLSDLLSAGGAVVELTRRGEETLSIEERIYKINRFRPDIAVRIRLSTGGEDEQNACTLFHYPGSEKGILLASELSERLGGLPPCAEWKRTASSSPFLRSTSCPAVVISGGSIDRSSDGRIFANPLHALMKAEGVAASVIASAGGEPVQQTIRIVMDGRPVAGAAVSIDRQMTRLTDESGNVLFTCLMAGEHLMSVVLPGEARARLLPFRVEQGTPATISLEP